MAYTSLVSNWQTVDPIKDYLPYDEIERRAQKEDEEKLAQYLEQYYAAPEILRRDKEYAALDASIQERLNNLSSIIGSSDYSHGRFNKQNNFQLVQDWAKYSRGVKKATLLSKLLQEKAAHGDSMIYTGKVYDENTPLSEIDENSVNKGVKADTYKALAAHLVSQLNLNPEEVSTLYNGAIRILKTGASVEEALAQAGTSGSMLSRQLADLKQASGVTDERELKRLDEALKQGIIAGSGEKYSQMNDPTISYNLERLRLTEAQEKREEQKAYRKAMLGNWDELVNNGHAIKIDDTHYQYNDTIYTVDSNGKPIKITSATSTENKPTLNPNADRTREFKIEGPWKDKLEMAINGNAESLDNDYKYQIGSYGNLRDKLPLTIQNKLEGANMTDDDIIHILRREDSNEITIYYPEYNKPFKYPGKGNGDKSKT